MERPAGSPVPQTDPEALGRTFARLLETNPDAPCFANLEIGDKEARVLALKLQSYTGIKKLDLTDNELGDDGVSALCDTLESLPFLQEILLGENLISDDGAASIARLITSCPALRKLDLSNNCIRDRGAAALARSLRRAPELKELDLSCNVIGRNGAAALFREYLALRRPRIFIDQNPLVEQVFAAFPEGGTFDWNAPPGLAQRRLRAGPRQATLNIGLPASEGQVIQTYVEEPSFLDVSVEASPRSVRSSPRRVSFPREPGSPGGGGGGGGGGAEWRPVGAGTAGAGAGRAGGFTQKRYKFFTELALVAQALSASFDDFVRSPSVAAAQPALAEVQLDVSQLQPVVKTVVMLAKASRDHSRKQEAQHKTELEMVGYVWQQKLARIREKKGARVRHMAERLEELMAAHGRQLREARAEAERARGEAESARTEGQRTIVAKEAQLQRADAELAQLTREISMTDEIHAEVHRVLDELRGELEKSQERNAELEKQSASAAVELEIERASVARLEAEIERLRQIEHPYVQHLEHLRDDAAHRVASAESERSGWKKSEAYLEQQRDALQREKEALQAELAEAARRAEAGEHERGDLRRELNELRALNESREEFLRLEMVSHGQKVLELRGERDAARAERDAALDRAEAGEARGERLASENELLRGRVESLEGERNGLATEQALLVEKLRALDAARAEAEAQLGMALGELEALRRVQEEYGRVVSEKERLIEENGNLHNDLNTVATQLDEISERFRLMEATTKDLEEELAARDVRTREAVAASEALEARLVESERKNGELEEAVRLLDTEIEELRKQTQRTIAEAEKRVAECMSTTSRAFLDTQNGLKELEKMHGVGKGLEGGASDRLVDVYRRKAAEADRIGIELERLKADVDARDRELREMRRDYEHASAKAREADQREAALTARLEAAKAERDGLASERERLTRELSRLEERAANADEERRATEERAKAAEERGRKAREEQEREVARERREGDERRRAEVEAERKKAEAEVERERRQRDELQKRIDEMRDGATRSAELQERLKQKEAQLDALTKRTGELDGELRRLRAERAELDKYSAVKELRDRGIKQLEGKETPATKVAFRAGLLPGKQHAQKPVTIRVQQGRLTWTDPKGNANSAPLEKIFYVAKGKASEILEKYGTTVDSNQCFSVYIDRPERSDLPVRTLDLCCRTTSERDAWYTALTALVVQRYLDQLPLEAPPALGLAAGAGAGS
eukprot:tig00020723_g13496.t1